MTDEAVTVAIVGLGRAGWNIHGEVLKGRADFRVVAAVDLSEERRQEAAAQMPGCAVFAELGEMLRTVGPELVVVATPQANHEQDCRAVLETGASCVLEKPIAPDLAGAKRIVEKAERSAGELFVFHQHLFGQDYQFLREVVDSGVLGEIVELRLNWTRYTRRNDWQTLRKNGGGLLRNYASHALSIVLPLLDSPVARLTAVLRQVKDPGDCEDHVHLLLEGESGRVADVLISTACAVPMDRFVLLGTRGAAVSVGEKGAKLRYVEEAALPELQVGEGAAEGRRYVVEEELPWREEECPLAESPGVGGFYDNVFAVLRKGGEMVITPVSAVEVARVVDWAAGGRDPLLGDASGPEAQ